jgi:hypothetical protein
MSLFRDKLLDTALRFVAEHNKFTPSSIMAVRSPNALTHHLFPTKRVTRTNEECLETFKVAQKVFKKFILEVIDENAAIVDEQARKVVLHLAGTSETIAGNYQSEYIYIFKMNEDGTLVDAIWEGFDTAYLLDFEKRLNGITF